jgi:hypothetical protein
MAEAGAILRAEGVEFGYGGPALALRGVRAELRAGRLMGLLGPNGGGKSTFFKGCLGLLRPSAGSITLQGRGVERLSAMERARALAYVPQDSPPAFPWTVREMVSMGRTPHMGRRPYLSALDRQAVEAAIESVGLGDLADLEAPGRRRPLGERGRLLQKDRRGGRLGDEGEGPVRINRDDNRDDGPGLALGPGVVGLGELDDVEAVLAEGRAHGGGRGGLAGRQLQLDLGHDFLCHLSAPENLPPR